MDFDDKVIEILKDVEVDPDTGCWIYQGNIDPTIGYGRVQIAGVRYHTHRLSAYIHLGLDLNNWRQFSCHKCSNRRCCNPEHLYVGDNKSNQRDVAGDYCKRGHYRVGNTRMKKRTNGTSYRLCRICERESPSRRKER